MSSCKKKTMFLQWKKLSQMDKRLLHFLQLDGVDWHINNIINLKLEWKQVTTVKYWFQ